MYSAVVVVFVLHLLEKSECADTTVSACYSNTCSTASKLPNVACKYDKGIMIKSLELRKFSEYACDLNCNWNEQCCTNGDIKELDDTTTELAQLYIKCSCQSSCNIAETLKEFATSERGTWFMKMVYSCVTLVSCSSAMVTTEATTTVKQTTGTGVTSSNGDNSSTESTEATATVKQTTGTSVTSSYEYSSSTKSQFVTTITESLTTLPASTTPTPTSPDTTQAGNGGGTQKMSYKDTGDDDAGFPIAAAVSIPLAVIAVAAVVIAVLLCRRFQGKSKRESDIYDGTRDKHVKPIPLDNPADNKHAHVVKEIQVANNNSDEPAGTEYAECGEIDEYLKPVDHGLLQKIGNEAMYVNQDTGAGNVYIEVLPDDDIVSGEDNERSTTDHIPLHYEDIEKPGNNNVESAAAYTDLRELDKNGPSTYQMLTPRTEQTSGT